MAAYTIITNNPKVSVLYADVSRLVNASAVEVLILVRNAVHKGAVLLNHPQSGSLRPGINPFKSILITEQRSQLDLQSLRLVEEALSAYKKNGTVKYKAYNEELLTDFQTLDLDLTVSAISGLPPDVC